MATRCNGKTKNNQRCKRKIHNTSGYCFIHNTSECENPHIHTTIDQLTNTFGVDCPVCMELININKDTELDCKHPICIDCAKQLFDNRCPICRATLSSKKLKYEDIKIIENRRQEETNNRNQELLEELLEVFSSEDFITSNPSQTLQQPENITTSHNNTTNIPTNNIFLSSLPSQNIRLGRMSMTLYMM